MKACEVEKYHEVGGESIYDHPQVKACDKCHRSAMWSQDVGTCTNLVRMMRSQDNLKAEIVTAMVGIPALLTFHTPCKCPS